MKTNKITLITTLVITTISLIVLIMIGNGCLLYDLSLAIFGSSLLAFIVSMIAYFNERRVTMERFYYESIKVLKSIYSINRVLTELPQEYVTGYCRSFFFEKDKNDNIKQVISDVHEFYKKEYSIEYPKEQIKIDLEELKSSYCAHIDEFLYFDKLEIYELGNYFSYMSFVLEKDTNELAKEIYGLISNVYRMIEDENFHFRLLKNGEGNLSVCIDKAICLDNVISKQNIELKGDSLFVIQNKELARKLENRLELFRKKIYFEKCEVIKDNDLEYTNYKVKNLSHYKTDNL